MNPILIIVLLISHLPEAAADTPLAVEVGSRIRVTTTSNSSKRIIASVQAIHPDTLVLRHRLPYVLSNLKERFGTLRIPSNTITGLEVSNGMHGTLLGAVSGLSAGLGVVILLDTTEMLGAGHEQELALGWIAPLSVIAGTALGARLGRRERWTQVPVSALQLSLSYRYRSPTFTLRRFWNI